MATSADEARRLEYVPLDELLAAPRNPKRHDLDALARSIDTFGYVEPVVVDERIGRLVAGHGRVERLRADRDGGGSPPDGVTGDWRVPVVRGWASVSDAHAEAYLAASNRLVELGGWDDEQLASLLHDLAAGDADLLTASGYSAADLAALTAGLPKARLTDPDDAPSLPAADPICAAGDVWLLGPHRLAVGSATDDDRHAAVTQGQPVQLLLTDPPYGVSYVGAGGKSIQNDDLRDERLRALIRAGLQPAADRLQPGGPFYVFGPSGDQQLPFRLALEDAKLPVRQECVWVKNNLVLGRSDWQPKHESVLSGGEVWDREFDVALYGWQPGAPHPFAGSGSTLIACHGTGRVAAVIELDAAYADVICHRYQAHTGVLPILESTGEPRDFTAAR